MPAPDGLRALQLHVPKASSQALLLEGKANLLRLRQETPLNNDELKAVDEGIAAHNELVAKLSAVPTLDQMAPPRVETLPGAAQKGMTPEAESR